MRNLSVLSTAILILCLCMPLFSGTHVVSSKTSFDSAISSAIPGDTIVWKSGVYHDIHMVIGSSQVVIEAEVPGKVVFTGASKTLISGNHNTLCGFQYLSGNIGSDAVIVINGSYNHITQVNIKDYDCTKYLVINSSGERNKVSYCNLEHRANSLDKNILSILVDANRPGYHTIGYCSFKNFDGTGGDEGVEPIRIGLSTQGEFISRSVVEYCYFTQCNGDGEIISNKARQNVFRYNTFEDNPVAELVLRHGDEGVVYGNFFLNGKGGIRVKEGQHHVIYNNYFSGLKERSIILMNYDVDPLDSITIAYNTFVNSAMIRLGSPGLYTPAHITLANNIFSDPETYLFSEGTGTETWIGNIAHGSLGISKPEGIRIADPGLELNSEGYQELLATSTSIDSAQPGIPVLHNYPGLDIDFEVTYDLMRQPRPSDISMKDIGCSEFLHETMVTPHATSENTGPSYLHGANRQVSTTATTAEKPNIMIWVADDQYLASVGCYGGDPVQTPNIDKFAAEGLRFTRAYSASSICTPSRSALYTGMYPIRNGAHPNHSGLKRDIASMPSIMRELGYRCALVGKEGVHERPTRPTNTFVWDELFPHIGDPVPGATWGEKVSRKHRDMDWDGVEGFIFEGDLPFCMFVAASLPHGPELDRIENGLEGYPANNWTTDMQFGRYMDMLERAGKENNTLVIYLSDNGSNTPRSKYTLYEPGVHVPMIIRWPGQVEPGTVSHQLVDFTDVMPTLMAIAGAEPGKEMDGISLLPLMRGVDKSLRDDLFLSFSCLGVNDVYEPYPIRAVVTEQFKLIRYLNHTINPPRGNDVSKVPEYELFDLQSDPQELKNLARDASYTGILDQMKSRLEKWTVKVGDSGMETEYEAVAMFPDKLKDL